MTWLKGDALTHEQEKAMALGRFFVNDYIDIVDVRLDRVMNNILYKSMMMDIAESHQSLQRGVQMEGWWE